ncbi:hypothetical protein LCGC14_1012430 [marine sediment metagenome]|uniref:Uncharacterized protein n=1 Tax=marine sediment metagenome TaxID=412755 RepID=A0A0F9NLB7_9ZZZZ
MYKERRAELAEKVMLVMLQSVLDLDRPSIGTLIAKLTPEVLAANAVRWADALIAELEKP